LCQQVVQGHVYRGAGRRCRGVSPAILTTECRQVANIPCPSQKLYPALLRP
jgi:hypothetical protein